MSDDEAVIIMVDSNLQRETLLPSEKAFAYKMKLEAARRRQGARTDLEDSPSSGKSTREILAENSPDSHEQIRRYIRLTSLVRSLLDRVDLGKLPMRTAVELSYLREPEQVELDAILTARGKVPSFAQATRLRTLSEKDPLTRGDILAELDSDKKEKKAPPLKIPRSSVNRFFSPDASEKDITEAIVKALELYRIQGGKMP
jgi:ParB family chromosome partitioning protein